MRGFALLSVCLLALCCSESKTVDARAEIVIEQATLAFGDVPVLNRRELPLPIHNAGAAPLVVESVSVLEVGTPFSVVSFPPGVEGGVTSNAVISFTPSEQKAYAATLVIASDDPDQPAIQVALAGNGSTVAGMETDPSVDFGSLCEGASATQVLHIRSTGTADLIVEEIRFAEGTSPEFTFVSSTRTPAIVSKGGEMTLTLRVSTSEASPALLSGAVIVGGTDPGRRSVTIPITAKVNRAPKAMIADVPDVAPGATVTFDGAASADVDSSAPVTFAWSLKASPVGSASQPAPLDGPQTKLTLDLPGGYTVALVVTDSLGCPSKPATKGVLAKPAQHLVVELVWDNLSSDLDLHMVPEGEAFFGPKDCYFAVGHMQPDWGVAGDKSDDPSLDRDALTGYGPEIIDYMTPATGRYRVMVHFYSAHGSKAPATGATVRVYEFGVVKAEMRRTLYDEGSQWEALSVDWPSGAITEINQVR